MGPGTPANAWRIPPHSLQSRTNNMVELGVNIDHVATLRQARRTYEPDPVWAAMEAELGGADGITIHLREDRRHINDRDVRALRETVQCKLNLEMSVSPEIIEIALRTLPNQATLVPERRQEVTTEGGIDLTGATDTSHAVHGLNYRNVAPIAAIEGMRELNIGHAIVSRAIFTGLREAVREMKCLMNDVPRASRP